jgi:nucleotide-binding universal stress UspA family protein
MSTIRHILALMNDGDNTEQVLALAAALARRHGASLQALHAVAPAVNGAYMTPEVAAMAVQYAEQSDHDRRQAAAGRAAASAARWGVDIPFSATEGDAMAGALAAVRGADLVVMAQPVSGDGAPTGMAPGLLVRAGVPLLFVPDIPLPTEADGSPRCGQRILVAWSPARETARALRDALPLLAAARRVDVVRWVAPDDDPEDDPLPAVCAHLARHGVPAQGQRVVRPQGVGPIGTGWTPDVPVAEALLSHTADTDADLIVMGGYGHARAWELLLGGVTRTILASMTVPVLMSH